MFVQARQRAVSNWGVELASTAEMAEHFGVGHTTMWRWTRKPGFPASVMFVQPVGRGMGAELWDLHQVMEWRAAEVQRAAELAAERRFHTAQARHAREVLANRQARERTDAEIRKMYAAGVELIEIADRLGVDYSRARRVTVDLRRRRRVPQRRLWTDDELHAVLAAFGSGSQVEYEKWRRRQTEYRPAASTISAHIGWDRTTRRT